MTPETIKKIIKDTRAIVNHIRRNSQKTVENAKQTLRETSKRLSKK